MLLTPFLLSSDQRQKRSLTKDIIPFLYSIIFQYTNLLSFETEAHIVHTIPSIREHCHSYLYYIRHKTLEITPLQTTFQNIFNPVHGINWIRGIIYRTIHPQNNNIYSRCCYYLFPQPDIIQ